MSNPLKPGQYLSHVRSNGNPYYSTPRKGRILGITVLEEAQDPENPNLAIVALSICSHQELNFSRKIGFAQARQNLEEKNVFFYARQDFDYAEERALNSTAIPDGIAEVFCNLSWAGRIIPASEKAALQLLYLAKEYGYEINEDIKSEASLIIKAKQIEEQEAREAADALLNPAEDPIGPAVEAQAPVEQEVDGA